MISTFENYLFEHTGLAEADVRRISAVAVQRKLRRNEFLFREGEICRHKVFIMSGLLRTFGITPDGSEHILQFSPELTWTLDAESYDRQIPSRFQISAVEPSDLLLWTKNDFEGLLAEFPLLKSYAAQVISGNIYSSRQRLLTALSATPEEKYEDFVQNSPDLLTRLPLRMIAAYLGISLKTLNRVRQAQFLRS